MDSIYVSKTGCNMKDQPCVVNLVQLHSLGTRLLSCLPMEHVNFPEFVGSLPTFSLEQCRTCEVSKQGRV